LHEGITEELLLDRINRVFRILKKKLLTAIGVQLSYAVYLINIIFL